MSSNREQAFYYNPLENQELIEGEVRLEGMGLSIFKSGAFQSESRLYATREGLRFSPDSQLSDRCFMAMDVRTGRLVSQRQIPHFAFLHTQAIEGGFQLTVSENAPDVLQFEAFSSSLKIEPQNNYPLVMAEIHATKDIPGIDQGDESAEWLSDFLGKQVRLLFQQPSHPRERQERAPQYEELATVLRFADSFPYTALSYTNLEIINRKLRLTDTNFPFLDAYAHRMNFLFGGSFNEHEHVGKFFRIGEFCGMFFRPKVRCQMPTNDYKNGASRGGKVAKDYLKTLINSHDDLAIPQAWRYKEVGEAESARQIPQSSLGVDIIPIIEGWISVGDRLEILEEAPVL